MNKYKLNSNIRKLTYESKSNNKLCPYWVSGFADAESSFSI